MPRKKLPKPAELPKIIGRVRKETVADLKTRTVEREQLKKINSYDAAIIAWRHIVAEEPLNGLAKEYSVTQKSIVKAINEVRSMNLIRVVSAPDMKALGLDTSCFGGRLSALDDVDVSTLTYIDDAADPNPYNPRRHTYKRQQMTSEEIKLSLILIRLGKMTTGEVCKKYGLSNQTFRDYKALYSPHGRVVRDKDGTLSRTNDRLDRMKRRRTASTPFPVRKLDAETQASAEKALEELLQAQTGIYPTAT